MILTVYAHLGENQLILRPSVTIVAGHTISDVAFFARLVLKLADLTIDYFQAAAGILAAEKCFKGRHHDFRIGRLLQLRQSFVENCAVYHMDWFITSHDLHPACNLEPFITNRFAGRIDLLQGTALEIFGGRIEFGH